MLNDEMMLSVIIPMHNPDLNVLWNSIEHIIEKKTFTTEIIVVNDGSEQYVDDFFSRIDQTKLNIKYIKQPNQGVSVARNRGIKESRGKYVTFLDSDDSLDIEVVDINMLMHSYDIILFDYEQNGSRIKLFDHNIRLKNNALYSQILNVALTSDRVNSACSKIYKREIVNNVIFEANMVSGEDAVFFLECLDRSTSVKYVERILYSYSFNEISYVNRVRKHRTKVLRNVLYLSKIKKMIGVKNNCEKNIMEKNSEMLVFAYFKSYLFYLRFYKIDHCIRETNNNLLHCISGEKLSLQARVMLFIIKHDLTYLAKITDKFVVPIYKRLKKWRIQH